MGLNFRVETFGVSVKLHFFSEDLSKNSESIKDKIASRTAPQRKSVLDPVIFLTSCSFVSRPPQLFQHITEKQCKMAGASRLSLFPIFMILVKTNLKAEICLTLSLQ